MVLILVPEKIIYFSLIIRTHDLFEKCFQYRFRVLLIPDPLDTLADWWSVGYP